MVTQQFVDNPWFIVFIVLVLWALRSLFVPSSVFKGWFGEKKTALNIWISLDATIYRRFHDVILPSINGSTQIDHVLVSPYGIFIVETKNINGWVFGSEDQAKWTKSVYGKNYSFQNPLRQTFRQKKILSQYLDLDELNIHIVIFFVGDCKFKTKLPSNVIKSGLGRYIKRFKTRVLSPSEISQISDKLEKHISESSVTTRDHVRSLRERHSSTTVCPKCGSNLVERTVKKGARAGSKFLGCESFPKCRFSKNL